MNKNQEAFDLAKEIINDSPYELWTPEQYAEAWEDVYKRQMYEICKVFAELIKI